MSDCDVCGESLLRDDEVVAWFVGDRAVVVHKMCDNVIVVKLSR